MKTSKNGTYKKILLYIAVALIAVTLLLPLALRKYLSTSGAASKISRLLSDNLGQPVAIRSVGISDGTLQLNGLTVASPEGFQSSKLLSVDSVTVKPIWFKLLSDKRTFEKIAVEGITVDLRRNKAGVWNFDKLRRRFSSPKPSSAELLIRQLKVAKATLQVNDARIAGLSLDISNLATKGSQKSGFQLEFDDPGRNHYALSGKGRLGKEPELELSLSSPSIALKSLPEILRVKSGYLPERGKADLQLSAELRKGVIRSGGKINFSSAALPGVGKGTPFSGNLSLSVGYDLHKDLLSIDRVTLQLDQLLALRLSGTVHELRRAKDFVLDLDTDQIDIGSIAHLVPELGRKKIAIGGKLDRSSLHLSGNARDGITTARGKLGFSHGSLKQQEQLFFNDLNVAAALSVTGNSLTATGKAVQGRSELKPLLETLDAPFKITLDRHLKTLRAESPALSATARGMAFTGRLSYSDGTAQVEHAAVKAKDLAVTLEHFTARVPVKQISAETVRYPLRVDFSGCDLRRGDALLKKASGSMHGAYALAPQQKWLEGTAEFKAEKAAWQEKEAGAPALQAEFSKSGGKANFKAALLGGSLRGEAAFNPFAPQERVEFKISSAGIQLAGVTKYAGLRGDLALSGGSLEAGCNGSYSKSAGLFCHLEAIGKDIAATGKGGKTLVSAGGFNVNADLAGQKLTINRAQLSAGKELTVNASGQLEDALRPGRHGRIAFTAPSTSLGALMDSFLNILPRALQEATVDGDLAADGTVDLQDGKMLLDGTVRLGNISIDAPSQKIKIAAINGVLPLSLDLSGKTAVKPPASSSFSRQNYDALLEQLRQSSKNTATITVGRSSFGGLSLDSLKLRLRAAQGITEIISLDSSLYDGGLFGKGFVTTQKGLLYRGDILLNGLSLVQLCKAFPAIAGYMSGRIDGIISIQGKGKQLSDLTGFSDFWARETAAEKMLVSKEFLQKLSGKKLSGFFFSSDRAYDHAGIKTALEKGFLTFDSLDISHTNFLGVRDLSVTIAPSQNRIAIDHLLNSIKEATVRGKGAAGAAGKDAPAAAPLETEFKWAE